MYRESTIPPWAGFLIIGITFLTIYGIWVFFPRELFRQECFYAAQAFEYTLKHPMVTIHETPVRNAYPIYPALCAFLYRCLGLPMETALRLVTVFFIAAGTLLVYFSAALGNGKRAGMVGAAMYCSTLLFLDKGVTGAPHAMSAFWLLAAQMSFFYFGLRRGKWNLAWPLCAVLLMTGFFSGGFLVLALFFIPMFFMRRLIAGRSKYRNVGFAAAVMIVLLGGVGRLAVQWTLERTTGGTMFFKDFMDPDFLGEFLLYWVKLPVRLLPWSFIAWIPFCVALQRLDNKPLFSKYLRIAFFVTAVVLWLIPKNDSRELFYLTGNLAILCGVYYELGMRRFGERLRRLAPVAEYGALAVALMLAVGFWGGENLLSRCFSLGLSLKFRQAPDMIWFVGPAIVFVLVLGGVLRWMRRKMPVWIVLLSLTLMAGCFYGVIMLRYQAQDKAKGDFGRMIRKTLLENSGKDGKNLILYKTGTAPLYGELFYAGARIIELPSADQLPDNTSADIYLISSSFPQNPKWSWSNLLPENFTYQERRIMLWRGKRHSQEKFN